MGDIATFSLLANYNQWMNHRLYTAAEQLPNTELVLDRGAFFASILATLNHLVAGDTLWLKRFAQHPANFTALQPIIELPPVTNLRELLYSDIRQLRQRRELVDNVIVAWASALKAEHLEHVLHYQNTQGILGTKRFGSLLTHFFNHQTHHRGQATTLLFQAGIDVGMTDLLALIDNVE